jgi:hypothetical protein
MGRVAGAMAENTGSRGDLRFYTNNGSAGTGLTEVMTIDHTGNVGIGTSNPAVWSKLHVYDGGTDNNYIQVENTVEESGLRLTNTNADWLIHIDDNSFNNLSYGALGFYDYEKNTYPFMIDSAGQIGIGTVTPDYKLEVNDFASVGPIAIIKNTSLTTGGNGLDIQTGPIVNPSASNAYLRFKDGDGDVVGKISGNGSGGVTYHTTSDRRLKTNIKEYNSGLDLVKAIQPRIYERKSLLGKFEIGFIAQELQQVFPQAVSGDSVGDIKEDPMGVDYGLITPVLVAAVKELNELVKQQEIVINAQKSEISNLKVDRENEITSLEEASSKQKALEERILALEKMMVTGQVIRQCK